MTVITRSISAAVHVAMNRSWYQKQLQIIEGLLLTQGVALLECDAPTEFRVSDEILDDIAPEFWRQRVKITSPRISAEELAGIVESAVKDGTPVLFLTDFLNALAEEDIYPAPVHNPAHS